MSRVKEYSREDVLERSSELFWAKGYEATSVSDIVAHTGINKHSLYKEFGDKEGLFVECLEYYAQFMSRDLMAILAREPLGLGNIEEFFRDRAKYANAKRCRGCFLINSVSDQELLSAKTNRWIRELLATHDEYFYNCLAAAQGRGEIPQDRDCTALAGYLSCFLRGLMSVGRSKSSAVPPEQLIEMAMEVVRGR